MKRKIGLLLLLALITGVLFLLISHFSRASEGVVDEQDMVVYLASINWPPYYGESLENQGFVTEIIRTAFMNEGYDLRVDFIPWDIAIEQTKEGVYDGLFTMWHSNERERDFRFSDSFIPNDLVFFQMKEDPLIEFETLDDLQAYTIGAVSDYTYTEEFWSADLNLDLSTHEHMLFQKLTNGRVDLVVSDRFTAQALIADYVPEHSDEIIQVGDPIQSLDQHLVFPKSNERVDVLLEAFNDALFEMRLSGQFDEILERHNFSYHAN